MSASCCNEPRSLNRLWITCVIVGGVLLYLAFRAP